MVIGVNVIPLSISIGEVKNLALYAEWYEDVVTRRWVDNIYRSNDPFDMYCPPRDNMVEQKAFSSFRTLNLMVTEPTSTFDRLIGKTTRDLTINIQLPEMDGLGSSGCIQFHDIDIDLCTNAYGTNPESQHYDQIIRHCARSGLPMDSSYRIYVADGSPDDIAFKLMGMKTIFKSLFKPESYLAKILPVCVIDGIKEGLLCPVRRIAWGV